MLLLACLLACSGPTDKDHGDTDGEDTGGEDTAAETGDTDTGDASESGDTSDTSDTSDTDDTSDTGETSDTSDTSDTGRPPDEDHDGYRADVDCDDTNPAINPGVREVCDDLNIDEDCSGRADNDDDTVDPDTRRYWSEDLDGDGWGSGEPVDACDGPRGWVDQYGDCDETDPAINGGADEICDGAAVDEDCDGLIDDADPDMLPDGLSTFYLDADGDGYGDDSRLIRACAAGSGAAAVGGDCNEAGSAVYPGAPESCNIYGIDFDCDGLINDDDPDVDPSTMATWYADADGDGYGDPAATTRACDPPAGTVTNATDCDDGDGTANPRGVEICDDGIDQDCDGGPSPDCGIGGTLEIGYARDPAWTLTAETFFDFAVGGDLDGDGAEDLYVSYGGTSVIAPGGGAIVRHAGLPSADTDWEAGLWRVDGTTKGAAVGASIAVGDLDGDGATDVASGSTASSIYAPWAGVARVYTAAASLDTDAWFSFEGETAYAYEGMDVLVGEGTGDGAADLVVVGSNHSVVYPGPLVAGVHVVGDAGLVVSQDTAPQRGQLADVDGDGVSSLILPFPNKTYGRAASGVVYTVDVTRTGAVDPEAGEFDGVIYGYYEDERDGQAVGFADVNADGYTDTLIGDDDGEIDVHYGPRDTGASVAAEIRIDTGDRDPISLIHCPGDLDGDGTIDLAVGISANNQVKVYAGPLTDYTGSSDPETAIIVNYADPLGYTHLYGPGDVDEDGYDDLMVGGLATFSLLVGGGI